VLLLSALLMALLVRDTPGEKGLKPYGEGEITAKKRSSTAWEGLPLEQLKKHPGFFMMALCCFLSCLSVYIMQHNLVPFFQDCGMSATRASRIYGTMMLLLGFAKLGFGALCDVIGPKRVTLLCHLACSIGLTLVLVLPQTDMAMIGALVLFDMANPLTTIIFPLLSMDLFGYQGQNQYIGFITAMTSAANIISSPVANTVRDTMGTYRPVFWGAIVLSAAMLLLYPMLFALVKRDRKKLDAQEETENAVG
jgi:predicted MFS family arabinose efflux permease